MPQPTPPGPGVAQAIVTPPPEGVTYGASPQGMPPPEPLTQRMTPYVYEAAPQHPHMLHPVPAPHGHGPGMPPVMAATAHLVAAAPGPAKRGWKKSGPTIGRASGLLLLALAGLAILGALFVVFSLLE